jgi:hypothetical protein
MRSNHRKETFRNLAVFAMIISLMVTATGTLPDFAPVDADRGLTVDLNDLILNTRQMADAAHHPESFSKSFNDVVRSFRLVSGIDHRLSKEKPQGAFKYSSQNMLIVSDTVSSHLQNGRHIIQQSALDYPSLMTSPPVPPPEIT